MYTRLTREREKEKKKQLHYIILNYNKFSKKSNKDTLEEKKSLMYNTIEVET